MRPRVLGGALEACLAAPADAELRAARLSATSIASKALQADIAFVDAQLEQLLGRQRGADPDQPAGRLDRPRGGVRRAHSADRALRDARAPLLRHRAGAASYESASVAQRGDQPHRPARTPRRADGHRLGPQPIRASISAPPRRAQRARPDRHPSTRRARPPRLPTLLATAHPNSPTTIGVTITPGETAGGDGAQRYAVRRRNLACRPPALAGPHGAHESLPHDGA